jgi:putative SOS response-associated peptidase YedK
MCGRFAAQLPLEFIRRLFATASAVPIIAPNWNVAPSEGAMVVRRHPGTGERRLDVLRWGLVPHFTKDLKACKRPINARSETASTSGMFRSALAARRCLVPADAFYEWKAVADGKQPYAIARRDAAPLAFAGLWEGWRDPSGATLRSFAILTTAANADMAVLHERMPVILEQGDWPAWLGEGEADANPLALLRPAAPGIVRLWPVSRAVNTVRNNGPALLDPIPDPIPDPNAPLPNMPPAGAVQAGENPV